MPDIRPTKTKTICLWVITPVFADSAAAALRSARAILGLNSVGKVRLEPCICLKASLDLQIGNLF